MRFICPLLVVKDIERSQAFYPTVLHSRVLADLGANVTMEGPFALQTEESWLAFTGLQAGQIRYGGCQSELYFESEDLDGFLERLRFYGEGSYVHSAKQMPWGQRVIRFYDPDDHIIEVGEPMHAVVKRMQAQGLSLEEIAARTMTPPEVLKQYAEENA